MNEEIARANQENETLKKKLKKVSILMILLFIKAWFIFY